MTHRFQYRPGATTVVCAGDWAVLVGVEPMHPLVARLYGLLQARPSMDQLTDLLAASYGQFTEAVVLHAATPVHTFLWGTGGLESTDGASVVGGPLGSEDRLTGLVGAWLGPVAVPSGSMLPAGQGVFLASRVETAPLAAPGPGVGQPASVPAGSARSPLPALAASGLTAPQAPESGVVAPLPYAPPSSPAVPYGPASVPSSGLLAPEPSYGLLEPEPLSVTSPGPDVPYVPVAPPPLAAGERDRSLEVDYTLRPRVALARVCPEGHLCPAYLEWCPECGGGLGGAPVEIPQPSLGRLVISTGGEVELDHDAILGRNPKLPPDFPGEPPELVRISDPTNDVSNRHLQVRVGQWQVVVRDLGSTNGTEIVRPGWAPMSLGAGQETTIEPGTRVILAGCVMLDYVQP